VSPLRAYHARMENRSRLIVIVLVAALALVGGIAAGALLTDDSGTTTATPTTAAQASPGGEATPGEEPTGAPASASPNGASPSPVASAEPTPSPTTAPAPSATITITSLFLDAEDNPDGTDRVIRWTSATGGVVAEIESVTPVGTTVMCLRTPTQELGCRTAGEGRLTAKTTKPKETFLLVLRGEGIAQPIVNVTLTFPARKPKITIENARFDGTSYPETNGIQALVTPREDGDVHVVAEWGGKPFLYELDLIEQGGPGSTVIQPDESSTGTDSTVPVAAPNPWKVVLQNTEMGFGVTPMTASIAWP
jgi:hypothetical protein